MADIPRSSLLGSFDVMLPNATDVQSSLCDRTCEFTLSIRWHMYVGYLIQSTARFDTSSSTQVQPPGKRAAISIRGWLYSCIHCR